MTKWGALVEILPMEARWLRLVQNSWAASWMPHSQPPVSRSVADSIVDDHLKACDEILVAVPPGVEGSVCGWIARRAPGVVSYLYVLHDFRRRGIADRLLREAGIDPRGARWRYVFSTRRMRQLCRPDPKRPDRVPWTGVTYGKEAERRAAGR